MKMKTKIKNKNQKGNEKVEEKERGWPKNWIGSWRDCMLGRSVVTYAPNGDCLYEPNNRTLQKIIPLG